MPGTLKWEDPGIAYAPPIGELLYQLSLLGWILEGFCAVATCTNRIETMCRIPQGIVAVCHFHAQQFAGMEDENAFLVNE